MKVRLPKVLTTRMEASTTREVALWTHVSDFLMRMRAQKKCGEKCNKVRRTICTGAGTGFQNGLN